MNETADPEITTRGGASWRWALMGLGVLALAASAAAAAWRFGLLAPPGVVIARDAHLIGEVVEIGAGFDARIERLKAQPGMQVTAGQLLVELEDDVLHAEVAARSAELALAGGRRATAARALERDRVLRDLSVEQAQANVALVEAEQRSAAATAERRSAEFARISSLYDDNAVSQARRDEALAARDSAVAALRQRDAALVAARSSLAEAKAERSGLAVRRFELEELDHRIEMARAGLAHAFADVVGVSPCS